MSGHIDMRPLGVSPTRAFDASGVVSTTNNGATLTVPANRFAITGDTVRVFPGYPVVAQLLSTFTSTHAATTFKAGGGPGGFQFCPEDPANGGPDPTTECAALPTGVNQTFMTANGGVSTVGTKNVVPTAAVGGVNARLIYTAGVAQFGGTFKINRVLQGSIAFCNTSATGAICTNQLRGGTRQWTPGGSCVATGCNFGGHRETVNVPQGAQFTSPMFGPQGSLTGGTTGTGGTIVVGPLGPLIPDSFGIGFPATTGMMRMDDDVGTTMEAPPTRTRQFSVTGYDNRTPSGVGNIKLVAAAYAWGGTTGATYPRTTALYMSNSGLAAVSGPGILVALGVLGGGYALRRRMLSKK